jgi:hypothetical protein
MLLSGKLRALPTGRWWVIVGLLAISTCGDSSVDTSTGTSAITAEDLATPGAEFPAAAAGESSESGPGVPADFSGDIHAKQPISPTVQAAIDAANALSAARNSPNQRQVDRGFAEQRQSKDANSPKNQAEQ